MYSNIAVYTNKICYNVNRHVQFKGGEFLPLTLYIILPISLILALSSGYFDSKGFTFLRVVAKTLSSLIFVIAGALSLAFTSSKLAVLILTGLLFGMIGDIFLCFNNKVLIDREKQYFLFGALNFAIGHVLYIAFFFTIVSRFNLWLIILIVMLPIIMIVTTKLTGINAGKMFYAMPIYFLIIGLMAATTINFYILNKSIASILALSAGILFVLSDIALIFKNFSKYKDNIFLIYFVLLTYYSAQALFATMIFFI